jgi:uncharacterized protein DUF4410
MKRLTQMLALLAITQILTGCFGAASHHVNFNPGYTPTRDTRVDVTSVTNDSGEQFDFDIAAELRTQLELELERQHLSFTNGSTTPHLCIEARIVDYEKGSAAGRWLLPGLGGTRLMIKARLITANGDEVGTASVVRSVETGGLYSIGQWKAIFHTAAKDIVDDLKSKLQAGTAT